MTKQYNYDWKTLLEEQQRSGLNMKKFCDINNIPYHSFKNHKYALRSTDLTTSAFVPVKQEQSTCVEFKVNGNLISFDTSLDDHAISRIVKAIIS